MILLLDNTVLSNFVLVNRIELLTEALGNEVATTPQVIGEFNDGVARGRLPETRLDWLEVVNLGAEEESLFRVSVTRSFNNETRTTFQGATAVFLWCGWREPVKGENLHSVFPSSNGFCCWHFSSKITHLGGTTSLGIKLYTSIYAVSTISL